MPLGLDLQGGVHFLLQVDQQGVLKRQEQVYEGNVRQLLREKNIRYSSVVAQRQGCGGGAAFGCRSHARRSTPSAPSTRT